MKIELCVDEAEAGMRFDSFIALKAGDMSRSQAARLIEAGAAEPERKNSYHVQAGEHYSLDIPEPEECAAEPEDIPLDILYEDDQVIVVNKPKGMVVHPDNVHHRGTLVNALLFHCHDLSGIGGVLRPGIVHRIDMDTTGSVIACKTDLAHESISAQLKEHNMGRKYIAIVCGHLKEKEGMIDAPIGRNEKDRKKMAVNYKNGKEAVTYYRVLKEFRDYSYIECRLKTGRTHQIRVHMAYIGHPLLGDRVYGHNDKISIRLEGQCLHAKELSFVHPVSGERIETDAPIPEYFESLLQKLP